MNAPARPDVPTRLYLAFYDGRACGTWFDRLVAAHDRGRAAGPFSHVELVFDLRPRGLSLCFSSSWRDGGVRFKPIDLAAGCGRHGARKWTLVPVPATAARVALVRAWCERRVGGRYDVPGVLAFKLPLVRHRLNWWFCSEICCAALQQSGLLRDALPHALSPNALFRLARRRFGAATFHV